MGLTARTQAQRDFIVEERARAIESGEFMEKLGLHELQGWAPPIGANFKRGESERDLRARAARSGIYLPGKTPDVLGEVIALRAAERAGAPPVYATVTNRFITSQGRIGGQTAWSIPDITESDFSSANISAASTTPGYLLGIMPANNAGVMGSPDDIGPALTVATATRAVGAGSNPFATLLSAWIFARTAAGAVYSPAAGSTVQVRVYSAAQGATQVASNLTAAKTLATLTTFWTLLALTVPAERQPVPFGVAITTAAVLFFGDLLAAELLVTGALNIQGNTLSVITELV